jgi:hypothetical protein
LHDDGRAEASKNVLLGFGDGFAGDAVIRWMDVLRADDLVEIVRQPVFVFGQRSETYVRPYQSKSGSEFRAPGVHRLGPTYRKNPTQPENKEE